MSVKVLARIGTEKYYTEVTAGKNIIITDEPLDKGGQDKGFNPFELLASSLATCTAATLRMYIDRKGWSVPEIDVEVEMENYPKTPYLREKSVTVKPFWKQNNWQDSTISQTRVLFIKCYTETWRLIPYFLKNRNLK